MTSPAVFDVALDFAIERVVAAPPAVVWAALTDPVHIREWYMPRAWGRVVHAEMDVRAGGIFRVDIAVGDGPVIANLGCVVSARAHEELVWTSMLFPGWRPAVFDDIPITAVSTLAAEGAGTRYVFTALHRNAEDLATNLSSGFREGTEIAIDQLMVHAAALAGRAP